MNLNEKHMLLNGYKIQSIYHSIAFPTNPIHFTLVWNKKHICFHLQHDPLMGRNDS